MKERTIWIVSLTVLATFFGGALWLAFQYLPLVSGKDAVETAFAPHPAREHALAGAVYRVDETGGILRSTDAGQSWDQIYETGGGLVRLAVAGDMLYGSYEDVAGQGQLILLAEGRETPLLIAQTLPVAASAMLGLPDGRLLIGGVDGSVRVAFGEVLAETLPTWVRFLRHDPGAERVIAISADGSRLEVDVSGTGFRLASATRAETPNAFTLHMPAAKDSGIRYDPGDEFRDCADCPLMTVVPGGTFTMGSPEDEPERDSDEGPLHDVSIRKFAIGKFEVTFDEWDSCVQDGYCRAIDDDRGWGRGDRPVITVSWQDITGEGVDERGFLAWMNSWVEGALYRLPSEAEWEYAARAETSTAYAFGPQISPEQANFGFSYEGGKTSPVGAYPTNAFRLHDMHGNVWEWVQDCWQPSYDGAPADGSAWLDGAGADCTRAVLRGGSWNLPAEFLRSALRFRGGRGLRSSGIGFRLARTLPGD